MSNDMPNDRYSYNVLMDEINRIAGNESDLESLILGCFDLVGKHLDISRIYYFRYTKMNHQVSCTYEWVADNISKQINNLQQICCIDVDWFYDCLTEDRIINISNVKDIMDDSTREILLKQDIKSILALPVYINNTFRGFIGFDECNTNRVWSAQEEHVLYTLAILCARSVKEKKLKNSIMVEHEQLLFLTDNIGGLSYAIDIETHEIIYANNELKKLYDTELEGRKCYEALQGKNDICSFCTNEMIPNVGDTHEWEHYNSFLDKEYYLIDRLIELPSGRKARFEIGIDITKRKKHENLLYKEKEMLRVMLMSIGDAVIATDSQGNITMMNKVAENLTGWGVSDALQNKLSNVFNIIDKASKEKCVSPIDTVLNKNNSIELGNDIVMISKDNIHRDISCNASPIRDDNNSIIGVILVFCDITEKIKKEQKIRFLSKIDTVTGLYNRSYLEQVLPQVDTPDNLPLAVIMGDLNGLKMTNDVFGHQKGDQLLSTIGSIIHDTCFDCDLAARWGGDEFVLLIKNATDSKVLEQCERIKHLCENSSSDNVCKFSISLGYAIKESTDQNINEVFKIAEDNMYNKKLLEGQSLRSSIITTMQTTLFERSHETEEHAERLGENCKKIGMYLKLSPKEIDDLHLIAKLHDIGKIAIKDEVLTKKGPLSEDEWVEMRKHPEIGYRILKSVPELSHIAEYILHHHERWDGQGYPQKLKGSKIPLLSRIITVVDAYDAMTNNRPYRDAMSRSEAIEKLLSDSGTHFDPTIVDIFVNHII